MITLSVVLIVLGEGLWLGLQPCSLTLNIAAVSFLSREVASPKRAFLQAMCYTLGRIAVYVALAAFLVGAAEQSNTFSAWFQTNMMRIVGPMLLIMAVLFLEWLPLRLGHIRAEKTGEALAKRGGVVASFLLGMLFAAAFCPISAVIFFGTLVPLAIKHQSPYILPGIFGVASAAIVIGFAIIIIFAANKLSKAFVAVQAIEKWLRLVTAIIFLAMGAHYTLEHTLMIHLFYGH